MTETETLGEMSMESTADHPKYVSPPSAPQSRVPWAWLVPEVVPEVVPEDSTADHPKYVSPSASVSPRPASQYLKAAPQSRVARVMMSSQFRRHLQTPWA